MSESREHKRRYNLRLQFIAEFDKWLESEPDHWRIFSHRKWKKARPVWKERDDA